jgi:hypothetical protein
MFSSLRKARFAPGLALAALAFALPATGGAQPAAPSPGQELIVNGDAEADVGAPSNNQIVKPSGWKTTGEFTVVQYGASGGFPDAKSPGPPNKGRNFFSGGNVALSTATQVVHLLPYATAIAAGGVKYHFSGWLGGFENQADFATATVTFRDATGAPLPGAATLGPVSPADRKDQTGSFYREASGPVPTRARSAEVSIVITRREGTYNDGEVDNLSLKLK